MRLTKHSATIALIRSEVFTKFQGDPAGGSDSYYVCTLCDKML